MVTWAWIIAQQKEGFYVFLLSKLGYTNDIINIYKQRSNWKLSSTLFLDVGENAVLPLRVQLHGVEGPTICFYFIGHENTAGSSVICYKKTALSL